MSKQGLTVLSLRKSVKHLINYCLKSNQLPIGNQKQFYDGAYELCIPKTSIS